ncbi:MAG: ATP synthase F1 subunit gamma [Patescibacteria group bacterium]|mgnify:CR=1 FL=1
MASLLILKRRIKTTQNISKTTKAFQMIAASRLKRAQEATLSARPYVEKLTGMSVGISKRVSPDNLDKYMILNKSDKKLVVLIAPDKGLCGGLVTNLAKETLNFYKENKNTDFITVGKKAGGIVRLLGGSAIASFDFGTTLPKYSAMYPIMSLIDDHFLNNKAGSVYLIHSEFNSVFSQHPFTKKLLPVSFEASEKKEEEIRPATATSGQTEAVFEPSIAELLPGLIRHYLEMSVFQAFLESYLSEQAARMLAMQNATDNAIDMIDELKLLYNKSRQEKITSEILDISGGVFANA